MSIQLYDLCGEDNTLRFSPTCWRVKMALHHKGLAFDAIPTPFTKIVEVDGGATKTVPYLIDGDDKVGDSFQIALYLDEKYPDAPALFNGEDGIAHARFVTAWTNTSLAMLIVGLIVKDIHDVLAPEDKVYFRKTREQMLKTSLEEFQTDRDDKLESLRAALTPLRVMLKDQPFICGNTPRYSDYIVFGTIKWLTTIAQFEVFEADDSVGKWHHNLDTLYTSK